MSTRIHDLKNKGFVTVAYPPELRLAVVETAELWTQFCDLPVVVKRGLPYSNDADGVGYEIKDGIGNKADHKENFDVTIAGKDWLERNAEAIENLVALDFIQHATKLVGMLKPILIDFARQCEEAFGLPNFVEEIENGEDAFFVRFIHYPPGAEVGTEIATAHVDQSGVTPHLFESGPGFEYLSYEGEWTPMLFSENGAVIIPAMQMQLRSDGSLRGLCHRVVVTPETVHTGRYSAVCFVQFKKTPKYDKATHGRLQEKKPGFNYSMPIEEFRKLFKK